ncbi:hypothetical protein B0H17DRAFT_1134095 [Mycena rosella]|uniref:Peptidase A1 domain-containing protein n=1 Tax=Mycena rosella TaxID=1033263 RepID=A0AAD7DGH2_MYCRO|nr:hypothetical protein B0H17DRAFT_1134095 [Mycena rosella]
MCSTFALWIPCVFFCTWLLALVESKPLLPYTNAPRALSRRSWTRELAPKDTVTLSYAAGCNPSEQRGAWLVSSVSGEDFKSAIILQVQAIPLREIGSSFHISHVSDSVSTGWGSQYAPKMHGRDGDIIQINRTFDFAPRQQLLPINSSLIDSSISDNFPDPAGLQIFCVDCTSALVFSVGIEMDISFDLNVTQAWVNVTINDFQHDINLEISLSESHTFSTFFDVLLVAVPDLGASTLSTPVIRARIEGMIGSSTAPRLTDLEISGAINFTVGASASIPSGATATFVATDFEQSSALGWDGATFDVHPFKLNSGSFEVTAGISLSPFLDATIAFGDSAGSSARLYLNTPHISGSASVAKNVNRECQPLGPNDFESFADALTFGAGLNISLEGNSTGDFPNGDVIFLTKGFPFGDLPTIADPLCMVIADGNAASTAGQSAGVAALLPAATGTLLPAAAAIPTFNIPGIESYYSAHGALPTNVNYTQMLMATTVPDDLKAAVQAAAATPHHKHRNVGAIVGGVIGGLAIIVLLGLGAWYFLRWRQNRQEVEEQNAAAWNGGLPKTGNCAIKWQERTGRVSTAPPSRMSPDSPGVKRQITQESRGEVQARSMLGAPESWHGRVLTGFRRGRAKTSRFLAGVKIRRAGRMIWRSVRVLGESQGGIDDEHERLIQDTARPRPITQLTLDADEQSTSRK